MSNLIRVRDAAELLGLSTCTVFRKCEQDALPHVRIGRSIRFRPEALQAFIGKNERAVRESASMKGAAK